MLVSYVVDLISAALRDAANDAWSKADIQDAIFEGEQAIALYHPHATTRDYTLNLAAGIKQSLDAGVNPLSHRVLDVKFNVGTDGTPGRSVRRVAVSDLDAINPAWRSATSSPVIREWVFDDREPNLFYVSPPAAVGAKLQISYSAVPAWPKSISASTQTTVRDVYMPALIEWALYRLFGHDAEGSVNISRSQQHLQNFAGMMGISLDAVASFSPKNPEHKR